MLKYIAGALIVLLLLVVILFLSYSISYYITAGHYNAKISAIVELHKLEKHDEGCEK